MPRSILEVDGEGGIRKCAMGAQMFDAADDGKYRAKRRVARTAEANDFTTDAIFLCSEGK